jgi:ABC-2 type transport system permease protein
MNTSSDALPGPASGSPAQPRTRPFYWSVRRELWENHSVYVAPLVVAALLVVGFMMSTVGMPERRRAVLELDLGQQQMAIDKPYLIAALLLVVTAFLVSVFYCLDALHGERQDRSILFWKSLPVSDLIAVLAKAAIPLAVVPIVVFVVIVVTQLVMMLLGNAVLLAHGVAATTFAQLPLFQHALILLYGLATLALWHAPIYGWLLLVSAFARRAAFLWAVLPPVALAIVERLAFGTRYVSSQLLYRLGGSFVEAFSVNWHTSGGILTFANLTPLRFLSTPGLWIGLAVAAALLFGAMRLRRYRGPL